MRWRHAGVTPGVAEVSSIIDHLSRVDEDEAVMLERALLRAHASSPEPVLRLVLAHVPDSQRPLRGRLTRVLGRVATLKPDAELQDLICALVDDPDLKTSLNAIAALGALPGQRSEDALVTAWERMAAAQMRPEYCRALIRALGKAGGSKAHTILAQYQPSGRDPEENRLLAQARLILGRTLARTKPSVLVDLLTIPPGCQVVLHTRRGLESFVTDELRELARDPSLTPALVGPGRLLLKAERLGHESVAIVSQVRCAERWAFLMGGKTAELAHAGRIEDALIQAMSDPKLQHWLEAATRGTVRYRIDWKEATNAQMWRLAERLAQVAPKLVNDPRESLWEWGVVREGRQRFSLELRAKGRADERFAYRNEAVPASSHPPLAAALARLADVRPDDVVWDPFCGAGTELIERAKRGPFAALWGTDLDESALQSSRVNLIKAGLSDACLEKADARTWDGARPTLTITNPPLGRRVARGTARTLIREVAAHIARQLAPGGRLVWVSPFPEDTRAVFEALGLKVTYRAAVDMGGFDAEMQRADKP